MHTLQNESEGAGSESADSDEYQPSSGDDNVTEDSDSDEDYSSISEGASSGCVASTVHCVRWKFRESVRIRENRNAKVWSEHEVHYVFAEIKTVKFLQSQLFYDLAK